MSLKHRWAAWRELWARYREIWLHFWRQRQHLTPPSLKANEADFLPAALAIQARPVSPLGRWVACILIGLLVVLFFWSVLGEIDIVVNAQGKIISSERAKTITAVEVASVRALHVTEDQVVHAGDVLIELDARAGQADADKARGEWESAALLAARSRALLDALSKNKAPELPVLPTVNQTRWHEAAAHLHAQWQDFVAKRERISGEIRHYAQALPLVEQRASDYAELARSRDVSVHAWQEKEQQRIDLASQLSDAGNQQASLLAETRKAAQDALAEALRAMQVFTQDERRAKVRGELFALHSPIDGTVQQLTVHTVGAAVPAAQPLMQIIPAQSVVEMQAFVESRDIGFVHEGQPVAVKIDAFEYTRYGTVPARVTHVSRDAIQDEKRGLIYSVKVELAKANLNIDGKEVKLGPGLSGSAEIKTGSRRVIEYVLSPLLQHARESLHER